MPGLSLRGYEFNRLLRGGAETGGAGFAGLKIAGSRRI